MFTASARVLGRASVLLLAAAASCAPRAASTARYAPADAGASGRAAGDTLRVTTFGDSNTDWGTGEAEPFVRAKSYISDTPPRLAPDAPNAPEQLAGLIEARWRATSARPIRVVNHAIAGTNTGGNAGTPARNRNGAPNVQTVVGGATRFDGEVLGRAYPWSGGEPTSAAYPSGAIRRVNAYVPGPDDFVYVSFGTNDLADAGIPPAQTVANLGWIVDHWTAAGHPADHLVFTTLAPRPERPAVADAIVAVNAGVTALARARGAGLIDLSGFTSADGGRTWRDSSQHIGDRLHYTTPVRAWLADQLVAYMRAHARASTRLPAPEPRR